MALDKATLYSVGTINYSCVMRKMPWAFQVQAPGGRKGGREEERDVELCPQGCAVGEVGQALFSAESWCHYLKVAVCQHAATAWLSWPSI